MQEQYFISIDIPGFFFLEKMAEAQGLMRLYQEPMPLTLHQQPQKDFKNSEQSSSCLFAIFCSFYMVWYIKNILTKAISRSTRKSLKDLISLTLPF